MSLEDRLAPGNLLGEALALAMPAQVMSLFSLAFESVDSSAPTLVNAVPDDAPPDIDPGVTLTSWIGPVGETFTSVATATQESAPIAFDPTLNDELFASTTPTLAQFSPSADTPSPSAGALGGLSASPMESSFSTSSSSPPASSAPPPVVPPPGMNPPSSPPTANNDAYNVSNGTLSVPASGVLANDTNPGGQPMTASLVASASHGIVSLNSDGSFSYTTMPAYSGTDTFTYRAMAGGQISNVATVTLTITAGTPVANNDAYNLPTNGGALVVSSGSGVLFNDTNPGGQPMSAVLDAAPQNGTVALNSNGSFTYTPTPNTSDFDSFTYHFTAGGVSSNVATVSLNVVVPTPPTAIDDFYTLPANGSPLVVSSASGLLANDVNPGGFAMTAVVYTQPGNGTLALNSDGSFTYTRNAGTTGADVFTYEVTSNGLTSNVATVTLNVGPPTANNDAYTVNAGSLTVAAPGVRGNDTNPGGLPMSALLVSAATHGTATLNSDGSFNYNSVIGYVGADSFTYQLTTGGLTSNTATVTLTIATPTPPKAIDDAYALPSNGTPLMFSASTGVLANDSGVSGQSITAVLNTSPSHGTLTLNSDGSGIYTPTTGYNGNDSFTYHNTSGGLSSNVATVTLLVGLVGVPDSYFLQHDTSLQTTVYNGVLANDSNVGGSTPVASLVSGPLHGTLSLNADGSFLYTPTAAYVGSDSFTYQAQANGKTTGPVLVSLTVVDQAPSSPDDSFTFHAGRVLQVAAPGLAAVATDLDTGDTLHFVLNSGPAHGQLQLAGDGSFTYQATQGFVGTDTFVYHTNDGALNSPTSGTVSIYVIDTAPLAGDVSFDMASNGVLNDPTKNVLSSSTDTDGDAMTARLLAGPANASQFALNANGTFVYAPTQGFVGTNTFTFVANDGTLDSPPATVTINVTANALAHDHYYVLPASGSLSISAADGLLNNAFNPSSYPISAVLVGQPSSGSVQVNGDGSFVYTPPAGGTTVDVTFGFTLPLPGGGLGGAVSQAVLVAVQPRLTLISEEFNDTSAGVQNGKVFDITPDSNGKAYSSTWSFMAANTRDPFALVAGDKYNLVAQFAIDKPQLITGILNNLRFQGTSPFLFPLINMKVKTTLAGHTVTATWTDVRAPAKASVNDTVDQQWAIAGISAVILTAAYTAKHKIYVLAGAPTSPAGSKLYHTVVRVGTEAAQGLVATTAAEKLVVSAAIVKEFQRRNLTSAELTYSISILNQSLTLPMPLAYYGKWTVGLTVGTTAQLVANADGDCNAWSRFFIDVVRVQGVTLDPTTALRSIKVDPDRLNAYDATRFPVAGRMLDNDDIPFALMLVKGWALTGGDATNTAKLDPGAVDHQNRAYLWEPTPHVTFTSSVPVQGNTRPLALFRSHTIVQITYLDPTTENPMTILFDPSYGTVSKGTGSVDTDLTLIKAQSRLLSWQKQSLDFVGLYYRRPDTAAPAFKADLRMTAVTPATDRLFVNYR